MALPYGVMRNAHRRFDEIHTKLKAKLYNTFPVSEFLTAAFAPHQAAYAKMPVAMRIERRGPGSIHFKYLDGNTEKRVTLYTSYYSGVNTLSERWPVRNDACFTLSDVPDAFKAIVVQQAIDIDVLDRKKELMDQALKSLNTYYNTLAQACHIWPCFRALIIADPTKYGVTAADVPETTRMTDEQRHAIPKSEIERWTLVYNDLIMREMLLK